MSRVTGSRELAKRLAQIPESILKELQPALRKGADDVASDARSLAQSSVRTGALQATITATGPGETTPAYASDGGRRTAGEGQAFITAGSPQVRIAHLVEFGTEERFHKDGSSTGKMEPEPFLLPAWRLNAKRVKNRIRRALRKAVKEGAASA